MRDGAARQGSSNYGGLGGLRTATRKRERARGGWAVSDDCFVRLWTGQRAPVHGSGGVAWVDGGGSSSSIFCFAYRRRFESVKPWAVVICGFCNLVMAAMVDCGRGQPRVWNGQGMVKLRVLFRIEFGSEVSSQVVFIRHGWWLFE
ncbi:hypothetical protein M0R45_019429 [Rubus argutus]